MASLIHPSAAIDPGAELAPDVKVGPFCAIGPDVTIDSGTELRAHVVIEGPTTIGKNNQFFPGVVIGSPPQDISFKNSPTRVEIGDNNLVREYATINRGTEKDRGVTTVHNNTFIMSYVHVAHDCIVHDGAILANAVTLAGHVVVEAGATVGGLTPVHQFVRIGRLAFVGGASRISQDVPPFIRIAGNPSKVFDLNSIGLQRAGVSTDDRKILKQAFRLIFRNRLSLPNALKQIADTIESTPLLDEFIQFVRNSKRGIHT